MTKIISICNQKGGTGKTTTAINFSAFLGIANRKTLLIDLDPQGNATSGVGYNISSEDSSIYDIFIGKVKPELAIKQTNWPNLYLIPSTISLTGAEIELVSLPNRELVLKEILTNIKREFDYIVIDAPPSLGLLTVNALSATDSVVVPIQCEYYALEGVSKLMQTIELIKNNLNPYLELEGVLLTMADFRTRLTLQVIEEVKNYFKDKAFKTIIPRNVKLAEAPSFGKPINFYDPYCVGAKAYLNFSEEVIKEHIDILVALRSGG